MLQQHVLGNRNHSDIPVSDSFAVAARNALRGRPLLFVGDSVTRHACVTAEHTLNSMNARYTHQRTDCVYSMSIKFCTPDCSACSIWTMQIRLMVINPFWSSRGTKVLQLTQHRTRPLVIVPSVSSRATRRTVSICDLPMRDTGAPAHIHTGINSSHWRLCCTVVNGTGQAHLRPTPTAGT